MWNNQACIYSNVFSYPSMLCFFATVGTEGDRGLLRCFKLQIYPHWLVQISPDALDGVYAEILPDLVVTATQCAKPTNRLTNKSQTDQFSHFTLHCMHCLISLSRLTQNIKNREYKATSVCSNTSTTAINPNHSFAMKHAFVTPGVCEDYLLTRDYYMLHMLRYFLPSSSVRNQPLSYLRHQR